MILLTRKRGLFIIVSRYSGFLRTSVQRCRHTVPRFYVPKVKPAKALPRGENGGEENIYH